MIPILIQQGWRGNKEGKVSHENTYVYKYGSFWDIYKRIRVISRLWNISLNKGLKYEIDKGIEDDRLRHHYES